jgi:hypothetical protein
MDHILLGLSYYYEITNDAAVLSMGKKLADRLVKEFPTAQALFNQGSLEQNCAILHGVAHFTV